MKSRKSIFTMFVFYYEVMFVTIFVIAVVVCSYMLRTMENEIHEVYNSTITQIGQYVDESLEGYQKTTMEVAVQPEINSMALHMGILDDSQRQSMIKIQQYLNNIIVNGNAIEQIYIFFSNEDFVLSDQGYIETVHFYNVYQKKMFSSQDEWEKFLMESRLSQICQRGGRLIFTTSVPLNSSNKRNAVVCMTVDPESIMHRFSYHTDKYQNITIIADDEGNTITNYQLSQEMIEYILANRDKSVYKIGKDDALVSSVDSFVDGWKYISVVYKKSLFKNAILARNIMIAVGFLSVMVGLFLALLLGTKNTMPIVKLQEERDNIAIHLNEHKKELWNRYLLQLLKDYPISPFPEGFGFMKQAEELDDAWKIVALISSDINSVEYIEKAATEIIQHYNLKGLYQLQIDDYVCCILLVDENADPERVSSIISGLYKILDDEMSLIGYSQPIHQNDMLPVAYEQAKEAVIYKQLTGKSGAELIELQDTRMTNAVSMHELIKIYNVIKVGDYMDAEKMFDDISVKYLSNEKISAKMLKRNMEILTDVIITSLMEGETLDDVSDSMEKLFERLFNCVSVAEYSKKIKELFMQLRERANTAKQLNTSKQQEEMERMLHEHYRDPNFCVSMMAEHFGMHPSHLSRKYKQYYNVNLLDKIHQLRIEEAKRMLAEKNITINEIGRLVGYNTEVTFLRAFKRVEGVTPKTYREMLSMAGKAAQRDQIS